jgi:ABC-type polar amino acid transport system ATPase subunit
VVLFDEPTSALDGDTGVKKLLDGGMTDEKFMEVVIAPKIINKLTVDFLP